MSIAILISVGTLAIAWYFFCILYLGFIRPEPEDGKESFREFVKLSVPALSGTLATYVGMHLCLMALPEGEGPPESGFGFAAVLAYVVSLIFAMVAWYRNGENTDPTIVALAKLFLGLIGGVLAVALNVNAK